MEIDGDRPVGARIEFAGDDGHAVIISGYHDAGDGFFDIEDSFWGPATYDYETFRTNYCLRAGVWTHTYPLG